MGWLVTLGILVLLAVLPLGIHIRYDEDGVLGKLIAGPIKILLFPKPKKEKKEKPKKEKSPQKKKKKTSAATATAAEAPKKKGGSVMDFLPLVDVALGLLNDLRRKLRVDCLELKVVMAGGDPCDLAVNYGKAWAALGNLQPLLERVLVVKKRDIDIECDFIDNIKIINLNFFYFGFFLFRLFRSSSLLCRSLYF